MVVPQLVSDPNDEKMRSRFWRPWLQSAGFATKRAADPGSLTLEDITELGLAAFTDPARPETVEAVAGCRSARDRRQEDHRRPCPHRTRGGRELRLATSGGVLTGADIKGMDDGLSCPAPEAHIIARAAPGHKLQLVQALQAQRNLVAMG